MSGQPNDHGGAHGGLRDGPVRSLLSLDPLRGVCVPWGGSLRQKRVRTRSTLCAHDRGESGLTRRAHAHARRDEKQLYNPASHAAGPQVIPLADPKPVIVRRKLQKQGNPDNPTYMIAVPKEWVQQHGLEQSDPLTVIANRDLHIVAPGHEAEVDDLLHEYIRAAGLAAPPKPPEKRKEGDETTEA